MSCDENAEALLKVFRRFDKDKDGSLSLSDLVTVFHGLGHSNADINKLAAQIDTNADGSIQYEEFVAWILGAQDGWDEERGILLAHHAEKARKQFRTQAKSSKTADKLALELEGDQAKKSLGELAASEKPPKGCLAVCAAANCLLKGTSKKAQWPECREMLADSDSFISQLKALDFSKTPSYVVQVLRDMTKLPYFDYDEMKEKSLAAAILAEWVLTGCQAVKHSTPLDALRKDAELAEGLLAAHRENAE